MADQVLLRRIYLDVCVLSRPFDDQAQARIRLETEAVKLILSHVKQGSLRLIVSPIHLIEIEAIGESEERQTLQRILREMGHRPKFDTLAARRRAEELTRSKIGVADAVHLAFAEQSRADFVTVDDRLLKRAQRADLLIWIGSPLEYCEKENLR